MVLVIYFVASFFGMLGEFYFLLMDNFCYLASLMFLDSPFAMR